MATGKVTADSVNALQPGAQEFVLWDDKLPGFGVKVTPAGAKVYLLQYRIGGRRGKTRRYTIGNEGAFRAASARKEAERLYGLVKQGRDIMAERQSANEAQQAAVELAFSPFVREFAKTKLKAKWPRSWKQTLGCMKLHAFPHLKDKPLSDITKDDIRKLLKRLDHAPATRRNLYAALSYLFNQAVKDDILTGSPMDGLEAPPVAAERDHTLSEDELRWLWGATPAIAAPYGPILRLLVILAQRRGEVAGLDWRELDRAKGEWDLPAARAKNASRSIIPLPASAVAELDALAGGDKWPRHGLVFASRSGTAPSGFSKAKLAVDALMAEAAAKEGGTVHPWRIHDLRRTVATNLQRLGTPFAVTEHLLNHKEKTRTGIGKIYQRHDHWPEKRAALNTWEEDLARIVSSGTPTVLQFRAKENA